MDYDKTWGNGIVEQVSLDLQNEFPNMKGFSARNLWNMKKWYQFYSKDWEKLQQLVEKFENSTAYNTLKMHQVGAEIQEKDFLQQLVAESGEDEKVFQVGGEMPLQIIQKVLRRSKLS